MQFEYTEQEQQELQGLLTEPQTCRRTNPQMVEMGRSSLD